MIFINVAYVLCILCNLMQTLFAPTFLGGFLTVLGIAERKSSQQIWDKLCQVCVCVCVCVYFSNASKLQDYPRVLRSNYMVCTSTFYSAISKEPVPVLHVLCPNTAMACSTDHHIHCYSSPAQVTVNCELTIYSKVLP